MLINLDSMIEEEEFEQVVEKDAQVEEAPEMVGSLLLVSVTADLISARATDCNDEILSALSAAESSSLAVAVNVAVEPVAEGEGDAEAEEGARGRFLACDIDIDVATACTIEGDA
jgi:hypothetical protein